jgi:hypothetical protein
VECAVCGGGRDRWASDDESFRRWRQFPSDISMECRAGHATPLPLMPRERWWQAAVTSPAEKVKKERLKAMLR